jgi:hypothetical protein
MVGLTTIPEAGIDDPDTGHADLLFAPDSREIYAG